MPSSTPAWSRWPSGLTPTSSNGTTRSCARWGAFPASQRQVLVAKYLDDQSVEQIAADTGRTRAQVQSLLQRGRDGLRRQLGAGDG